MAEIQVSNIEENGEGYDAIAQTDNDFPNMVNHVEIIICSEDKPGKVIYQGEAPWARLVFPVVMAELDDAVLTAASNQQAATIEWSTFDSLIEV